MTRYSVSGTLTPDATTADTGDPAGTHNGQPYWSWTNDAGTWFLWFSQEAFGRYRYAINHGLDESLMWSGSFLNPLPIGNYEANLGMCTGLSTVAEYVPPASDPVLTARKFLVIDALQNIQAGQRVMIPWSEVE